MMHPSTSSFLCETRKERFVVIHHNSNGALEHALFKDCLFSREEQAQTRTSL